MDHKGITYERSQSLKVNYCRILSVNIIRETISWRTAQWVTGAVEGGVSTEGRRGGGVSGVVELFPMLTGVIIIQIHT